MAMHHICILHVTNLSKICLQMATNVHPLVVNSMWLLENIAKECWYKIFLLLTPSFSLLSSLSDWRTLQSSVLASSLTSKTNLLCPFTGLCGPKRLSGPLATLTQTLWKQAGHHLCMSWIHWRRAGWLGGWMCCCVLVCLGVSHVPCAFTGYLSCDLHFGASTEAKIVR